MFGRRQQRTLRPGDANVTWMKGDGRQTGLFFLGHFWNGPDFFENNFAMFRGQTAVLKQRLQSMGDPLEIFWMFFPAPSWENKNFGKNGHLNC